MRYAVFGDIHGNLEAYQAVLEAIDKENVDRHFCVGDVVGYGANPTQCIELTKKLNCLSVCGNHDWAAVGKTGIEYFNPQAKAAALWTREAISPEDAKYLKALQLVHKDAELTLVHGTLHRPEEFNYVLDAYSARDTLEMMETGIAFIGHSHKPGIFILESGLPQQSLKTSIEITPQRKCLVNVGSVGQPRDLDWRAAFCIYDHDEQTLKIKRVEYDVKKAQGKILKAGLPTASAHRLEKGI